MDKEILKNTSLLFVTETIPANDIDDVIELTDLTQVTFPAYKSELEILNERIKLRLCVAFKIEARLFNIAENASLEDKELYKKALSDINMTVAMTKQKILEKSAFRYDTTFYNCLMLESHIFAYVNTMANLRNYKILGPQSILLRIY